MSRRSRETKCTDPPQSEALIQAACSAAIAARNDAVGIAKLCKGAATDPRIVQATVVEALAIAIPAFRQSFGQALCELERLRNAYGHGLADDVAAIFDRAYAVSRVLTEVGLSDSDLTEVVIARRLGALDERLSAWSQAKAEPAAPSIVASPDYRSVRWGDRLFEFSPTQAACVEVLMSCFERGTPSVGDEHILDSAGAASRRLAYVFRDHEAWGTLIIEGETKGTHRISADS
jgi:hypothetical protein